MTEIDFAQLSTVTGGYDKLAFDKARYEKLRSLYEREDPRVKRVSYRDGSTGFSFSTNKGGGLMCLTRRGTPAYECNTVPPRGAP